MGEVFTLKRHPFSRQPHSAFKLLHIFKRLTTSMSTLTLSKWDHTLYGFWWM